MIALFLACVPTEDIRTPPIIRGPQTDDEEEADVHEPSDSAIPEDTGPEDTSVPTPSELELCYPGPADDWSVCFPLVDYDPAWGADYAYSEPYNGSAQYAKPLRFLDLSVVDPDAALAENFVLDEFMQEWKGRYALMQPHAVETMQILRDRVGGPVTVNSGFRNVSYNAGVGGAEYSRHMYGDAIDMASSAASLSEIAGHCEDLDVGYVGWYETHIHCDWRNTPLDDALYGGARSGTATPQVDLGATLVPGLVWSAPAQGWDEGEPLREWVAYGVGGEILVEATSRHFLPPAGTASLQVTVGREIVLNAAVD